MEFPGMKIKKLRKERGWTQEQLAERVNVSPQVVSNWERNYTRLNHEDILRVAKTFNVDTNEIFDEADTIEDKKILFAKQIIEKFDFDPDDENFKQLVFDAIELGIKHNNKDTIH